MVFMCVNIVGVFMHNLMEHAQRKAFIDTRNCIAARLEMEDENEKLVSLSFFTKSGIDFLFGKSGNHLTGNGIDIFFRNGCFCRCFHNTWPWKWKTISFHRSRVNFTRSISRNMKMLGEVIFLCLFASTVITTFNCWLFSVLVWGRYIDTACISHHCVGANGFVNVIVLFPSIKDKRISYKSFHSKWIERRLSIR